ncbi:MAG: hypothetical protein KC550_01845 [Nanoarchaeota archaeon]|nr:hypothetical protein [Nanoarchaeota archaeon]
MDCQGYTINGNGTDIAIHLDSYNNFTFKNCNINNYFIGIYMITSSNNNLTNISINNIDYSSLYLKSVSLSNFFRIVSNNASTGIFLEHSNNNNLTYINSTNSSSRGLELRYGSNNNILKFLTIKNNYRGLYFHSAASGPYFNNISDSIITSNTYDNLYLRRSFGATFNNLFYNNTLGDISKVYAENWSFWRIDFNLSSSGNILYTDNISLINQTFYCFDSPTNNNCAYNSTILFISSENLNSGISIFPFQSVFSIFILLTSIFFFYTTN